ncbi:nucleoside triphosphate pyrophosphohydrolase [Carnimonas nigrificans]|uniref:nucleoside triphosphate pyrophosphohydrolase n=1 Tax=Carnimonas nigrificans TaxID=64323 RepID=UPI00046F8314|nr:nucleoside triphosphate pyrophosphohydrolase [Carnimonas nigrificans]
MNHRDRYTLEDLQTLMAVLRDEQYGCPWDVAQSWRSIVPHTIEEVYEVVDAIEREDFDEVRLELGDLLFQVAYYAQLAREEQRFDLADVIDGIVTKMIVRHPHVFPEGTLDSRRHGQSARTLNDADIKAQWEQRKQHERDISSDEPVAASLMDNVPHALPALLRAGKLSQRATRLGFDWPEHYHTSLKVDEELAEVREAAQQDDPDHLEEEVGDLLFAVANYARKLGIDPEQALRKANYKFERRFRGVEQRYQPGDQLSALEAYWQEVKAAE